MHVYMYVCACISPNAGWILIHYRHHIRINSHTSLHITAQTHAHAQQTPYHHSGNY
jgi:hypothetical protein